MLFANIISVVGVVAINKRVYNAGFHYPSVLMTLHFLVTWLFVVAARTMGVFEAKRIETWQYCKLGAAQVGSVALVNLSLFYNSVGTYQLLKFCVIFVTCGLEYAMYRKVYSFKTYVTLALLVGSISLATITSIQFSAIGLAIGVGGAVATSYYQICNKFIQNEFRVSPFQLLHYEQPFSAGWCALLALLTDDVGQLVNFQWTTDIVLLIVGSAVFAFGVNVTCYLIIGKTSPITYSVIGHVKTVSIFLVGYLFLGDKIAFTQFVWMCVAFGCIVYYGTIPAPPPAPSVSVSSGGGTACVDTGAAAGGCGAPSMVVCAGGQSSSGLSKVATPNADPLAPPTGAPAESPSLGKLDSYADVGPAVDHTSVSMMDVNAERQRMLSKTR
jgi:solute carrier family 35 protein E3